MIGPEWADLRLYTVSTSDQPVRFDPRGHRDVPCPNEINDHSTSKMTGVLTTLYMYSSPRYLIVEIRR